MSFARVVAIHLPALLCELVREEIREPSELFGVVEVEEGEEERDLAPKRLLLAGSEAAARCGVRPGQTIAEARAIVAGLVVKGVTRQSVRNALGRVAEVGLGFSPRVAVELG